MLHFNLTLSLNKTVSNVHVRFVNFMYYSSSHYLSVCLLDIKAANVSHCCHGTVEECQEEYVQMMGQTLSILQQLKNGSLG
jgi:hypothetical protein